MSNSSLRIAYCLPKLTGGADLRQQMLISKGLQSLGHSLTYVVPLDLYETLSTNDLQSQSLAPRTWSNTGWFNLASKITWRAQQMIGMPYLNVFSNYRLYDACLQCLPGHDVVQERNGLYKMGVAMACKRLKLPYVLFFDADDIFEQDFLGIPITGILRWRAKQIIQYTVDVANGIICVSGATKSRLVEHWHVPPEKIVVFPNGVDIQRFQPDPEKRAEVRASLGLDDNPVVIYVGSFNLWHDVATLVDAFAQVLTAIPQARLLLVGDGKKCAAMKQRANDLGIEYAVIFTGMQPQAEIPNLISAADIAVSPYPKMDHAWWGSSMKVFEYMASSIAIVISNVGQQVTEIFQNGKNGVLVAPGDASDMAAALIRLIGNPDLRLQLGYQAREDAVQKYSWKRYLSRLEYVYDAVIKRQSIDWI